MVQDSRFAVNSSKRKSFFLVSLVAVLFGFLLSIYSVFHHLSIRTTDSLGSFSCNVNSTISCDKVALSSYSEVLGVPLGVWGVAFFSLLFCSLLGTRAGSRKKTLSSLRLYSFFVLIGSLCSLILAYISLSLLGSMCLVCIGVYLSNFTLTGLLFFVKDELKTGTLGCKDYTKPLMSALIGFILVVGSFYIFRENLSSFLVKTEKETSVKVREGFEPIPKTLIAKPGATEHSISLATSPYMGKGEDYRLGSDEAPIVIHEFVDFECPACAMASRALKDLKTEFPSAVLLIFRNYPLDKSCNDNIKKDFHKNSCALAQLARCAGRKGKFWEFHDLAFNGQKSASLEKASEWALSVGLSPFEINNCLQDDAVLAKIRDDISQGDKLGVEGTPAIFVNGKKFEGDFQTLKNFVQVQIKSH